MWPVSVKVPDFGSYSSAVAFTSRPRPPASSTRPSVNSVAVSGNSGVMHGASRTKRQLSGVKYLRRNDAAARTVIVPCPTRDQHISVLQQGGTGLPSLGHHVSNG